MKLTRPAIVQALEKSFGNVTQAAQALSKGRATLYRDIKRLGLQDERVRVLQRLRK